MDRTTYISLLDKVHNQSLIDLNPPSICKVTRENLELLCPHLTSEQLEVIWRPCEEADRKWPLLRDGGGVEVPRIIIAIPPAFVSTVGHVIFFDYYITRVRNHKLTAKFGLSSLYPAPFGAPIWFINEALQFATQQWGNQLFPQKIVQDVHFWLSGPRQLQQNGRSTRRSIIIGLNKSIKDLRENPTKPLSQLVDDAIVYIDTSPYSTSHRIALSASELGGSCRWMFASVSCCIRCGSGLSYAHCESCGYYFKDESHFWDDSYIPLPPKVVEALRSDGHRFKKDPAFAWEREAKAFRKSMGKKLYRVS